MHVFADRIIFTIDESFSSPKGVFLPPSLIKEAFPVVVGTVVVAGPGHYDKNGRFWDNPIKVGDKIIVKRDHTYEFEYEDQKYYTTTSYYVLGTIVD